MEVFTLHEEDFPVAQEDPGDLRDAISKHVEWAAEKARLSSVPGHHYQGELVDKTGLEHTLDIAGIEAAEAEENSNNYLIRHKKAVIVISGAAALALVMGMRLKRRVD